jgi:hypothetical protein
LGPLRRTCQHLPDPPQWTSATSPSFLPTGVATCVPRIVELTVRRYEDARSLLSFLAEREMPSRADAITRQHLGTMSISSTPDVAQVGHGGQTVEQGGQVASTEGIGVVAGTGIGP